MNVQTREKAPTRPKHYGLPESAAAVLARCCMALSLCMGLCLPTVYNATLLAQEELAPEPGVLAELNPYLVVLHNVFREAYTDQVYLRVIVSGAPSNEVAMFVTMDNNIVLLTPQGNSIWSEYRASLRKRDHASSGNQSENPLDGEALSFSAAADTPLTRTSRVLPEKQISMIRKVWEDALLHATHLQEQGGRPDGTIFRYSAGIHGRGWISGESLSAASDSISHRLNRIVGLLIGYVKGESIESEIDVAIQDYWEAVGRRRKASYP